MIKAPESSQISTKSSTSGSREKAIKARRTFVKHEKRMQMLK